MATYLFNITLSGEGDNADEAWNHATEAFNMEDECIPEDYEILKEEI